MNPVNVLAIAAALDFSLPLAEKSATTKRDWMEINKVASLMLGVLTAIEYNETLLPKLREEARAQYLALREVQVRTCDKCQALRKSESEVAA